MHNYKFIEIMPEVTLIKDKDTSIYVVEGEKDAIVIDTGYGIYNLKEAVMEITSKPLIVVCTHGHIDHVFGSVYFDRVYMSKDDLPVYEKHKKLKAEMKESILKNEAFNPEDIEKWVNAEASEFESVAYGHTFDIGGNVLEVISLKGHTPGSIGLIDRKNRILFSGDGIIPHVWMQLPESTSIEEYLETILAAKEYKNDFDVIYHGHMGEAKATGFIDEVEQTLRAILAGGIGNSYNNEIAPGMIYKLNECEVVYNPDKIR